MGAKRLPRWITRMFAWVPTNCPLLFPFYLSAQLSMTEEVYSSPHLPPAFDGYRIAYASDIHFGPYLGAERALDLHERLSQLQADLLILGGDYGATTEDGLALFDLLPPFDFPDGAVGALGNHDLTAARADIQTLLQKMQQKGVQPLINDSISIVRDGQRLSIVSVDDIRMGQPITRQPRANFSPGFCAVCTAFAGCHPGFAGFRRFYPALDRAGTLTAGRWQSLGTASIPPASTVTATYRLEA